MTLTIILLLLLLLPAPDGAPRDFSVTARTSRTITLQWLPVLPSQQNGLIMNYSINCNDIFMFESVDDTIEMSDDFYSHTLSELTPGTVYVCTVAANTTEGAGPVAMVTVTTLEEGGYHICHVYCKPINIYVCTKEY